MKRVTKAHEAEVAKLKEEPEDMQILKLKRPKKESLVMKKSIFKEFLTKY